MDLDPRKPFPQSLQGTGPVVDARGIVQKYALPLGGARALRELAADLVFFNLGALYLYGHFRDAFLIEYMAELGRDVQIYFHKFNTPIFAGLEFRGDPSWNHGLMAVIVEEWPRLVDFLCSITATYAARDEVCRYGLQAFEVPDPLMLDLRHPVGPDDVIAVGAWGTYTNKGTVSFRQVGGTPTLGYRLPDEDMAVYARALFGGDNPVDARDDFKRGIIP